MKEIDADPKRKLFFHCTIGEDRTGYLSALWSLINNQDNNESNVHKLENVFEEDMCGNGYGSGNPNKPDFVVDHIRDELTVLFHKMSYLILVKNMITLDNLDLKACKREPSKRSKYFRAWSKQANKVAGKCDM